MLSPAEVVVPSLAMPSLAEVGVLSPAEAAVPSLANSARSLLAHAAAATSLVEVALALLYEGLCRTKNIPNRACLSEPLA